MPPHHDHTASGCRRLCSTAKRLPLSELKIKKSTCQNDDNYYKSSIVDLYMSYPRCEFEICSTCCQDFRKNNHSTCKEEVCPHPYRGKDYMHGGNPSQNVVSKNKNGDKLACYHAEFAKWKADLDDIISCPPKTAGGCGSAVLKLKCMLQEG